MIVPVELLVTLKVAIEKFPVVAPDGMVKVAGTDTLGLLEFRVTTVPEAGAAVFNVTAPVEVDPPTTVFGLSERPVMLIAFNDRDAV